MSLAKINDSMALYFLRYWGWCQSGQPGGVRFTVCKVGYKEEGMDILASKINFQLTLFISTKLKYHSDLVFTIHSTNISVVAWFQKKSTLTYFSCPYCNWSIIMHVISINSTKRNLVDECVFWNTSISYRKPILNQCKSRYI